MKIISTCPCRASIWGGGTDIKSFSDRFGGVVFGMAINIRQKVILDTKSTKTKLLKGDNPNFINAFIKPYKIGEIGIEHTFDGTTESGMGSSASLAVALLGAIKRIKGEGMDRLKIAEEAYDIEVNKLKMFGGLQDQVHASYGGVNIIEFGKETKVNQLSPSFIEFLLPYMVLFYTGQNRKSGKIQEGFKKLTRDQIKSLNNIKALTIDAITAIRDKDVALIGELLDLAWQLKKRSNKGVSNDRIDRIYDLALKNGAIGGKVLGAGGGGHILFICPPDKQPNLKEVMAKMCCKWVDFSIDYNGLETRIL
jgi:D-glycero-alpha-D-manno-heptose-7-phosphate kinase